MLRGPAHRLSRPDGRPSRSRAATAVSGWSANSPSTPASRKATHSARPSPRSASVRAATQVRGQEGVLVAEGEGVHGEPRGVRVVDERAGRRRASRRRCGGSRGSCGRRRRRRSPRSRRGSRGATRCGASSSTRCTSGTGSSDRSSRRLAASKDWTNTGAPGWSRPAPRSASTSAGSSGMPAVGEVSGTLRLGVDTDRAAEFGGTAAPEGRGSRRRSAPVEPVEAGVRRPERRQPLDHAQGAQLGEREVVDEPAGARCPVDDAGGAPVGELGAARDVGGRPQLRLVPRDQDAVGGRDEVGFEVVGAQSGRPARRRRACARGGVPMRRGGR